MRTMRLALLLFLGLTASASAATFHTSFGGVISGSSLQCVVSNVGTAPVNVIIVLTDDAGTAVTPSTDTCASTYGGVLPPGVSCRALSAGPIGFRCSVEASPSKIRAALIGTTTSGQILFSIPATKK